MIIINNRLVLILLILIFWNRPSMAEEDNFAYSVDAGISGIDIALDQLPPQSEEFNNAEQYFIKIIQNCSSLTKEQCANAYYGEGRARNDNENDWNGAITYLEKAFELNPSCSECLVHKSYSLYNLARYDEALAEVDQALKVDPSNAHALSNKGLYYFHGFEKTDESGNRIWIKDAGEALKFFTKATDCDPNFGDAWWLQGEALEALGRKEEAADAYLKANNCEQGVSEQKIEQSV
ncbi:Tetratricopeptide repeat protein [uncultured archaeon]|nr:Tetratricopeptide repeat protein [uncultured archaeon]